jgi:hypothetical protein
MLVRRGIHEQRALHDAIVPPVIYLSIKSQKDAKRLTGTGGSAPAARQTSSETYLISICRINDGCVFINGFKDEEINDITP